MFFFEPLADFYLDQGILREKQGRDDLDHPSYWSNCYLRSNQFDYSTNGLKYSPTGVEGALKICRILTAPFDYAQDRLFDIEPAASEQDIKMPMDAAGSTLGELPDRESTIFECA